MKTDNIIRLEFATLTVVAAYFFIHHGFAWYWLIPMFFAYDLGMIGYVINSKVGAVSYNIAHSLLLPLILLVAYSVQPHEWMLFIALTQLLHIGMDRCLGYGLKYGTGFTHTHLGIIGRK